MAEPSSFFSRFLPEAQRLRALIGAGPNVVPVFLAQWANESSFGTSNLAKQNNLSGLSNGGPPNFRPFASVEEHTRAQADALQDPNYSAHYNLFLVSARANESPTILAQLLGLSKWDEGEYKGDDGQPGEKLLDIMQEHNLEKVTANYENALNVFVPLTETLAPAQRAQAQATQVSWTAAIGNFFTRLNQTIFDWDWWKRALWLLILLLIALLLIYLSLRGMTSPQQTAGDD